MVTTMTHNRHEEMTCSYTPVGAEGGQVKGIRNEKKEKKVQTSVMILWAIMIHQTLQQRRSQKERESLIKEQSQSTLGSFFTPPHPTSPPPPTPACVQTLLIIKAGEK